MSGMYDPWLVCVSVFVAIFVSYAALNIATRVSGASREKVYIWLAGGAIALGGGMWSNHLLGMLAWSQPTTLAYDATTTLVALAIAMATSGFALWISVGRRPGLGELAASAVVMGVGMCAMHYMAISALLLRPRVTYDLTLFTEAVAVAVGTSFAALWLFVRLRHRRPAHRRLKIAGAAVVMGLAISCMNYVAMAATKLPSGAVVPSGGSGDTSWLTAAIGFFAVGALVLTLFLLVYDAHLQRTRSHAAQLQLANEHLQHVATHDALTGLPNRVLLTDRLEQAIANAERSHGQLAVLLVDIDRFKAINDSLGHAAGDRLLREVAQRLRASVCKADTLARIGGDEFVLVLENVPGLHEVESVISGVLRNVSQPLELDAIDVHASSGIGVSLYPTDGTDAQTLLKHADAAKYHAKKSGPNTFQFFSPEMNEFTRERLELESALRNAVARREFVLHYQPKVEFASGHIIGAEALLRWNHPKRGLLPPAEFIPLAEECGLILPLGAWVLNEACRQLHTWHAEGLAHLRIAVNVSAQQFRDKHLLLVVRDALSRAQVAPRFLELELTESAVMQDAEHSVAVLRSLSELGVRISVDDFGTGYSSLSYLQRFPLNKVKIDRSFVREIVHRRGDSEIVRAIVSLAHSLRLAVIAEGVETAEQLDFLDRIGCDQYQGYLCSPPVPAPVLADLVRQNMVRLSDAPSLCDTMIGRSPLLPQAPR